MGKREDKSFLELKAKIKVAIGTFPAIMAVSVRKIVVFMSILNWGDASEVTLRKKHLLYLGLAVAFLQPFFSGLVLGFYFLTRDGLKKEGQIVIITSLIWGGIFLLFAYQMGMI